MAAAGSVVALPYHEPGIVTILIHASFILLLNTVNHALDRLLYVGLIGQILLGTAFGTPGVKWLTSGVETAVVDLGYLGLLLLVYEGGLSTSFGSLKANWALSCCVAATGISLPIALSYILTPLVNASPLQAFAAGAALCSTSLGTTFTVMQTSGLSTTRMGVVLTSAAMMDDIVGLVLVQVISNLGGGSGSFSAVTIVRPLLVSIAFGIFVPLCCRYVALPITLWVATWRRQHTEGLISRLTSKQHAAFVIHTAILLAMVTGSTYAGTSNLFAAYLAGATISWWDSDVHNSLGETRESGKKAERELSELRSTPSASRHNHETYSSPHDSDHNQQIAAGEKITSPSSDSSSPTQRLTQTHSEPPCSTSPLSGKSIFDTYYAQPVSRILKPFFFASIGFSIPITRMFTASIVWRGLVYTVLMIVGKLACGAWLLRFPRPTWLPKSTKSRKPANTTSSNALTTATANEVNARENNQPPEPTPPRANTSAKLSHTTPSPSQPVSLYPATILGSAMVARGEIGFLISSLAESNGIFGEEANGEMFLVVTWAIMLCTIIGPVVVGGAVRRLRALAAKREGGRDVLGVWGVS